jgi:UrcA family protein
MNIRSLHLRLRPLVLLLGAGSALGIGGHDCARAATAPDVAVSYRDLDLSNAVDVRLLYHRLQRAATDACGGEIPAMEIARHRVAQRCYAAALEHAVVQIDAPQLLAMYRRDMATQPRHG